MLTPDQVESKIKDLESSYADRDRRHHDVSLVRGNNLAAVFPRMFGNSVTDVPLVANYIDVVARDLAEMIGPLPSLNCVSGTITSDRARAFAAKRQKIGLHYWLRSNLRTKIISAVDNYLSYGYLPVRVEADFDEKFPLIRPFDPRGGYPEFNRAGTTVSFTQKKKVRASKLAKLYPTLAAVILREDQQQGYGVQSKPRDQDLHVYTYDDKDQSITFVTERRGTDGPLVLEHYPNKLSKCPIQCAVRPSGDDEIRGQFDDVLGPMAAKAMLAALGLEAAEKTVQAPIALPDDVMDLTIGADAILRSASPEKIARVRMDVGNAGLLESAKLDTELRFGTRYPDARSGTVQGSIVTGKGVEALQGTFDTQVKTHQLIIGELLRVLTGLCYEMDEVYWPNLRKEIRGTAEGVPFMEGYTPAKDINGDYTCDVTYGMMAGMDPNRGLVFLLQAQGAGLLDRATSMRQMPFDIDVTQLQQNMDVEKMRDSGLAGVEALMQSMGPMIEQGGDPTLALTGLGLAIKDRQAGKPIEDALMRFAPPPAPPQDPNAPPPADPNAPPGAAGAPGGGPGGQLPPGVQDSGLLQGVAPGQAGQAPGGRPALMQLLAQLGSAGKPNLSAGVKRSLPV